MVVAVACLLVAFALPLLEVVAEPFPQQEVAALLLQASVVVVAQLPALAAAVSGLLDDAARRERLGQTAAQRVAERYDLRSRCLPAQLALLQATS